MRFRVIPMMALTVLTLASIASAEHSYSATFALEASQEVTAPTGTPGAGTASVSINTASNAIIVSGSYAGMTSNVSGAHLHGPASPGANAGVKIALAHTGGTSGTLSLNGGYNEADEADILAGLWYINVHTATNGGGEIRGQVVLGHPVPATSIWALILTAAAISAGAAIIYRRQRSVA